MGMQTFGLGRTSPCIVEDSLVHESVDAHPCVSSGGTFGFGNLIFLCLG